MMQNTTLRTYLPMLLLAAVSVLIYWPALGHQFLINWDDLQYVIENPVAHGLTIENLKIAFTTSYVGNYAPLHILSYMIDYDIWGLRPSGFIFTNILLHTVNGMLFFLLLRRLAGNKVWIFAATLLFILHPVQVESVVWVSQRKNLLAMFFFLVAILSYISYRDRGGRSGTVCYCLAVAAFLLALLAKSVAVILPLTLILLDICYLERRSLRKQLLDKIPFFVAAAAFAFIAIQSHSSQVQGGMTTYHGGTPYATFLTMLTVLVTYLRLLVWPAGLSAFYAVPIKTGIDLQVAGAALFCLLLVLAGVVLYRRFRPEFCWYTLFFVGLVPVSQIVPIVTLINDRYFYFPLLGGAPFLALILFRDKEWPDVIRSGKGLLVGSVAVVALSAMALVSYQRVGVWQDSYTLWSDAVQKAPNVALTHDCFGEGLLERGKLDEAIQQFIVAMQLRSTKSIDLLTSNERSDMASTLNNLGTAYAMKGNIDSAVEQFTAAISLNPVFAKAYFNLGNVLMHKGAPIDALRNFEEANRLSPGIPAFQANLRQTRDIVTGHNTSKASGTMEQR